MMLLTSGCKHLITNTFNCLHLILYCLSSSPGLCIKIKITHRVYKSTNVSLTKATQTTTTCRFGAHCTQGLPSWVYGLCRWLPPHLSVPPALVSRTPTPPVPLLPCCQLSQHHVLSPVLGSSKQVKAILIRRLGVLIRHLGIL